MQYLLIIVLFISMFYKSVFSESIAGSAKLEANITLISRGIHMVCFDMNVNVCFHFRGFETIIALPLSIGIFAHLGKYFRLQI